VGDTGKAKASEILEEQAHDRVDTAEDEEVSEGRLEVQGIVLARGGKGRKTIAEAQRHNASRMTTAQLKRELHVVKRFAEQPLVRQEWIAVLRVELARRGES
jgi:hypothetical protein